MLAQGRYEMQQYSKLDYAEETERAIVAMLTNLQKRVADFATILKECDDGHMHVYDPANSDNPPCRYVICTNMRAVCTS